MGDRRAALGGADSGFMRAAVVEAEQGFADGGIPIGATLVENRVVIATRRNRRVQHGDPIAHGEMDCFRSTGRRRSPGTPRCSRHAAVRWHRRCRPSPPARRPARRLAPSVPVGDARLAPLADGPARVGGRPTPRSGRRRALSPSAPLCQYPRGPRLPAAAHVPALGPVMPLGRPPSAQRA